MENKAALVYTMVTTKLWENIEITAGMKNNALDATTQDETITVNLYIMRIKKKSNMSLVSPEVTRGPNPAFEKFTAEPGGKVTPKRSVKVPAWGWVLIAISILVGISLAILLPILLIKTTTPVVTPSVSPTPSAASDPFSAIPANSVLFQHQVPVFDGLVKGASQVMQVVSEVVDFVLIGVNARTAYFSQNTQSGVISTASIVVGAATSSSWANVSTTNGLVYREYSPSEGDWYACFAGASPPLTCSVEMWPDDSIVNSRFFVGTIWNGVSDAMLFSLKAIDSETYGISVQTSAEALPQLTVPVPTLKGMTSEFVATLVYNTGQSFVTIGVVEQTTNVFSYATYLQTSTAPTLRTLKFDSIGEVLKWGVMSSDGQWLVILTTVRLLVYSRDTSSGQFDFALRDSITWPQSAFTPVQVAISEFNVVDTFYVVISTAEKQLKLAQVNKTQKRFVSDFMYSLTSSVLTNTSGPVSIVPTIANSRLFVNCSDDLGNYEVAIILLDVLN